VDKDMMQKIEIYVDSSVLFDALRQFGDIAPAAIGQRLLSVMLTGESPDVRDGIGLALYGIQVECEKNTVAGVSGGPDEQIL
jgi:hypothetical protein